MMGVPANGAMFMRNNGRIRATRVDVHHFDALA
jgi:hypothetical protein